MESKYLNFRETGRSQSGITAKIEVTNKNGGVLGEVNWFGRWRKYVFIAVQGIALDENCMNDISKYIVELTRNHKEDRYLA